MRPIIGKQMNKLGEKYKKNIIMYVYYSFYFQFLLKNSERLSVAMAIGPMDCREIQNRFTDLGFELEEEGLTK